MSMSPIRTGICVLAAFAVLAHGAVEPWSEAVLEIGAAALLLAWSWKALTDSELKLVWNPLLWPLLGFWLVAAFQLAMGITLVPFLTRIELLKYSALVALFFLCVQSYKTRSQWRNFVWFLLSLGFAVFVCHPAAFYVQREIVLGSGIAIRRDSFWPVRQPQSFRRSDGASRPAGVGHPNPGRGAARPIAVGNPVHPAADRSIVSVCFPGRNHKFCGGGGLSRNLDSRAP